MVWRSSAGKRAGTIAIVVLVMVTLGAGASALESRGPTTQGRTDVLVVGDSLVVAAAGDLTGLTPSGGHTVILAGVGASPCDLWAGYRAVPQFGGEYLSFGSTVASVRPKAVVLAFTGNPGVSAHACIARAGTAYSLADILAAYRSALQAMGTTAAAAGAHVYLSASPARNPGIPEGWQGDGQHGYNGDPAFNTMLRELALATGWTYDTSAAAAISGPGLGWALYLPCQAGTGAACIDGHEQVRYGGPDAIHCDAPGTNGADTPSYGSIRFARGLLRGPLERLGLRPLSRITLASTPTGRRCGGSPSSTTG